MKKPLEKDLLKEYIAVLETKQTAEWHDVKNELHSTIEQLNPLSFLKNGLSSFTNFSDLKSNLLNSAVAITTNYLSQNTVLGAFEKPIKKIAGNVLLNILNKLSPKKTITLK